MGQEQTKNEDPQHAPGDGQKTAPDMSDSYLELDLRVQALQFVQLSNWTHAQVRVEVRRHNEIMSIGMKKLSDSNLTVDDFRYLWRDISSVSEKKIELTKHLHSAARDERDRMILKHIEDFFSTRALELYKQVKEKLGTSITGDDLAQEGKAHLGKAGDNILDGFRNFVYTFQSEISRLEQEISAEASHPEADAQV